MLLSIYQKNLGGVIMEIINQLVEFIQSIIKTIKDLVANIRAENDKKN